MLTTSTPSSSLIVGDHAYAVVGYNSSGSLPYEVYNPWGMTSDGMAPGNPNVYGRFYANGTFLSQNFSGQYLGTGARPSMVDSEKAQLTEIGTTDRSAMGAGLSVKDLHSHRDLFAFDVIVSKGLRTLRHVKVTQIVDELFADLAK